MSVFDNAYLVTMSRAIAIYLRYYLVSMRRIIFCINLVNKVGMQCPKTPRLRCTTLFDLLWMGDTKGRLSCFRSCRNKGHISHIVAVIAQGFCFPLAHKTILLIATFGLIFLTTLGTNLCFVLSHCLALILSYPV